VKLHVIRHAVAEPQDEHRDEHGGNDARRGLTPRGAERFARAVEGLERLGIRFDLVLTSPLRRAVETAELLAPICTGEFETCAELASTPDEALLDRLAHAPFENVALVGHEPHASRLAVWLATGWRAHGDTPPQGGFALEKGGVLILEGEPRPGGMRLVASYPPSALRKLARR